MIRVLVQGGLGNQMFQYAVGRCLAEKLQTTLCLDTSWFHPMMRRRFELNQFGLSNVSMQFSALSFVSLLIFGKPSGERRYDCVYRENAPPADFGVLMCPDNSLVIGTYMSKKYFKEIREIIRADFSFEHLSLTDQTAEALGAIKVERSVAVHVRRGDYLVHFKYNVCTERYYMRAIQNMREALGSPYFFIFSDDPAWCRSFFTDNDCIVLDLEQSRKGSLYELYLMSACDHTIISNSSYSWWGAWLNDFPEQVVIAPDRWSNTEVQNPDICLPSWIRMPVT